MEITERWGQWDAAPPSSDTAAAGKGPAHITAQRSSSLLHQFKTHEFTLPSSSKFGGFFFFFLLSLQASNSEQQLYQTGTSSVRDVFPGWIKP